MQPGGRSKNVLFHISAVGLTSIGNRHERKTLSRKLELGNAEVTKP